MSLTRRRTGLLVLSGLTVLMVMLAGSYAEQVCQAPIDVSGTTRLPGWLADLKNRDALAYPAHVVVGTALNRFQCSPEAAGLQWVKAGAHARSDRDVAAAADGLAAARGRSDQAGAFDATLCAYVVSGYARPQQELVVAQAGLVCPAPH